jgi:F-type H+-transporting ATPase subunit epsilon
MCKRTQANWQESNKKLMPLKVEVVATDSQVWSGEASRVVLRTKSGEIGLLPGHSPLLASLADGPISIKPVEGEEIKAAIHGGFVTVDSNNVIVLAETAELASQIDVKRAQLAKEEATKSGDKEALKRAESRLAITGN